MLNEHGQDVPASIYSKATYRLHESFGERANQSMSTEPCDERTAPFVKPYANAKDPQPSTNRPSRYRKKDGVNST